MSDPISPKASDKPVNSTEWTLVPTTNYFPNPKNNNKHIAVPGNQIIKTANRFTLLHNLEAENTVLHGRQERFHFISFHLFLHIILQDLEIVHEYTTRI